MPSVLTGANLANRDLIYLGVSGDGDSASIGLRPVRACHPPRRQHGLYRREQRRVRPDQGPVLRHRRPRLEVQARRHQQRQRHRPRRHRAAARRDLRGALVLRRQDAAGAADQGRDRAPGRRLHRRDLALRRLQQSRRLDQELRLRARAQRGGEPPRLHHRPRADQGRLRAGHGRDGRAARRHDARAAQAQCRIRRARPARRHELPAAPRRQGADRHRPALRRRPSRRICTAISTRSMRRSIRSARRSCAPARRRSTRSTPALR